MIVRKGLWLGRGRLLVEGTSVGESVEIELEITEDPDGYTLLGEFSGPESGTVSMRVGADDVGTYLIDAQVGAFKFDGRGKLESEPNLALLWSPDHRQSVSVALFAAREGIGCRGFLQEKGKTRTWEILFRLKQKVVAGPNVVSLASRRR